MRTFGIAAVAVVVLALAGGAMASGDSSGHAAGRHAGHAITVFGHTVQLKLLDQGESGFTLGDQIVFSDDLLTEVNGKPAGVDGGVCTLVRVADAATQSGTVQCQVTYSLSGGQIVAEGLLPLVDGGFTGRHVAAITGGTGRFRTAHGESTLEFLRPGELNITLAIRR
jgi:hypothetical protein